MVVRVVSVSTSPARPRIVLAGLGHAHLFVLEAVRAGLFGDIDLVVCTNTERHVYSGMLPGWLGGRYVLDELCFDVPKLVASVGGTWIAQHVCAVDTATRCVRLANGEQVSYDVCSIAVGSAVAGANTPGVGDLAWPVKPLNHVLAFAERLDDLARRGVGEVVVVGGGIAGVELALNARARVAATPGVSVSLAMHGEQVAAERGTRASALCERALRDAGVRVWRGVMVQSVDDEHVHADRGGKAVPIPANAVVWATGSAAPAWLAEGGLPVDAHGYLPVDATLRVVGTERVFAAGDVATVTHAPDTPKAGVYAVRMGPHLVESLRHAVGRGPAPREFAPQRRWLSLMNVGDGSAIASWGPLALRARWAMRLKDTIDKRFIERFR